MTEQKFKSEFLMSNYIITNYICTSCEKRPNMLYVQNNLSPEYYLVCPYCSLVSITKTNIFKSKHPNTDLYKNDYPVSTTHEQSEWKTDINRTFTYKNYRIIINTVKKVTQFMPLTDIILYNKEGYAIAYTEDATNIYLFNGRAVGVFIRGSLYNYLGRPLGWYIDHWIRDNQGHYVFFTDLTEGGLLKPIKHMKPQKLPKNPKPYPRKIYPRKQAVIYNNLNWSRLSGIHFFNQYLENFHG